MDRNDFKELFAYILLGLVLMGITFWVVTQIEHKRAEAALAKLEESHDLQT